MTSPFWMKVPPLTVSEPMVGESLPKRMVASLVKVPPLTTTVPSDRRPTSSCLLVLPLLLPPRLWTVPELTTSELLDETRASSQEAIRGIDIALDDNLPVLVLSLHSPSLAPGNTEYAEDEAGVEALYDWLRAVYTYLGKRGVRSVTAREIIEAARR